MQIHIFIEMIRKIVAMKYHNQHYTLHIFVYYVLYIIVSTNIFALSNFLQAHKNLNIVNKFLESTNESANNEFLNYQNLFLL